MRIRDGSMACGIGEFTHQMRNMCRWPHLSGGMGAIAARLARQCHTVAKVVGTERIAAGGDIIRMRTKGADGTAV